MSVSHRLFLLSPESCGGERAQLILNDRAPCEVVLLGSIAGPRYVDLVDDVLEERLRFPPEFVGRGNMSCGGLLLRLAPARE